MLKLYAEKDGEPLPELPFEEGMRYENKRVFLLSTSPGQRGGINSIEAAKTRFPYHGADILAFFP